MPWQKLTGHINGDRVEVESKSGNRYPAETEYDWMNESVYKFFMNRCNDDKTRWAWVNFDGEKPVVEDTSSGDPNGGPPKSPPWDL